jgi:hypothetical protein
MNIPGDIAPIQISSHAYRDEWPVGISGDIQSNQWNYEKNSISTNILFHDFNIATSIGACILSTDIEKGDVKGFFLDNASRNLSINKYLAYITILSKYLKIIGCQSKEMLSFFDEYYLKGKQGIDFLDVFTHLKVEYYFKKCKSFSFDDYTYLKKLPKKYTVDYDGKVIKIKRSKIELMCHIIKAYPREFIDMFLASSVALGTEFFAIDIFLGKNLESEQLLNCFLKKYLAAGTMCSVTIAACIEYFETQTDNIYASKKCKCNPE